MLSLCYTLTYIRILSMMMHIIWFSVWLVDFILYIRIQIHTQLFKHEQLTLHLVQPWLKIMQMSSSLVFLLSSTGFNPAMVNLFFFFFVCLYDIINEDIFQND